MKRLTYGLLALALVATPQPTFAKRLIKGHIIVERNSDEQTRGDDSLQPQDTTDTTSQEPTPQDTTNTGDSTQQDTEQTTPQETTNTDDSTEEDTENTDVPVTPPPLQVLIPIPLDSFPVTPSDEASNNEDSTEQDTEETTSEEPAAPEDTTSQAPAPQDSTNTGDSTEEDTENTDVPVTPPPLQVLIPIPLDSFPVTPSDEDSNN
jgi:hypothetical protein